MVLSPRDARIVQESDSGLFLKSDGNLRDMLLVENSHLEAIAASDFLWIVSPDGYTGPPTALEIGFAYGNHVPIYSMDKVYDDRLVNFIERVPDIDGALARAYVI